MDKIQTAAIFFCLQKTILGKWIRPIAEHEEEINAHDQEVLVRVAKFFVEVAITAEFVFIELHEKGTEVSSFTKEKIQELLASDNMDTMFNDEWELEGIHSIVDGKPFVIPEDAIGYVSRVVSSFERRR